jgi:putative CocE/NonD family hydrolase
MIDCGDGVRLERGVPCRMSDGVVLVADHYYPVEAGPYPTLLMRQPYGRDIASTVVYAHPAWFARHGYNVVIQDVRGRGGSEGSFYPFRHERQDGADTIAALVERPECNGRVGMYGFSYQGMTQLLAAAARPKGLACIAPAMTAHDLYHGWFYNNGALRLASTLGWGLQMLKEDTRRLGLREASDKLEAAWANLPAQYLATPYGAHPAIYGEGLPTYVRDWLEHDSPGEYWSSMDVSMCLDELHIPALHVSGWYDTYLKGSVDGYRSLRAASGDDQYLIAGPWVHIPWGDRIGATSLGAEANLDTDAVLLRWFNHWLKDTGEFADEPRIRHFSISFGPQGGAWHSADVWPERLEAFYLHSEGRANSSKGDGALSGEAPVADEPPDLFVYDPEVPVVAPGGIAPASGPSNQAGMELGNHVLVYTGEVLKEPLHVFGTPEVAIYFATSAGASDLVVKLVCVRPSGDAMFVCVGVARSKELFAGDYAADRAQLWRFELEPTSCVFAAGDRIRVEIASCAYPLYDRNPGNDTAPRLADSWNWRRSTQTVFHDRTRPSAVCLPIVERGGEV